MITFEEVSKIYRGTEYASLHSINLTIEESDFVTFVGPSGSGKTTMFRLMLGEIKPSEGNVWFHDTNISSLKGGKLRKHRRKIGMVFQDFKLIDTKTAYENVAFAMEVAGRRDRDIKDMVMHILTLVNLADKANRFPKEMSGGEQQRIAIARAIVNEPEVILADEPTGNLDPRASFEVLEILNKINELGTTVCLATHDIEIVDALTGRIIGIKDGQIIEDSHQTSKRATQEAVVEHLRS